jgi:exonuclease SbcC
MDDLTRQIADGTSKIAKLRNADRERMNFSNSISQLTERTAAIKAQLKDWQAVGKKRLKEVTKLLESKRFAAGMDHNMPDLDEAERSLFDLQEKENRLTLEVGAARQKVSVLDDLRKRKTDYASTRDGLALLIGRHRALERALGKDGVPALLIEQSLPQIESKANELLDRLSDGQMSIRFVTQSEYRDRKRDDLKETLDIQISDAVGLRDYEMYSGGEAFRINFAIRLALSEVLARRKGARLQTLVIDEGFGSQDVRGRQRLIEAINLVKNDFAKILVITHLDELKDAFPTRIEVEKTERGSTINVI